MDSDEVDAPDRIQTVVQLEYEMASGSESVATKLRKSSNGRGCCATTTQNATSLASRSLRKPFVAASADC